MARVLFISKPVAPPWNDSGKNLVRDLACALAGHTPTVMGHVGQPPLPPPVVTRPLYPRREGGFAPRRLDQGRVFASLLLDRQHDLWHYFFAPNPLSCRVGGALRRLRSRPTVHTVSSAPLDPEAIVPQLFADLHVVLSEHTERRLVAAGLAADRIARIPPSVPPMQPPTEQERAAARRHFELPADAPVIVYPGDLEFGEGACLCLEALAAMRHPEALLVVACREKTPAARRARERLHDHVRRRGLEARVRFVGETPDIHALLGAADVVALPSRDLYAKMDYPLVLLEAMALQRPVVVASGSPAEELAEGDAALAVEPAAEALAAGFDALLGDAAARLARGQRAAMRVRERFSPSVMARAYAAVYERLLACPSGRG